MRNNTAYKAFQTTIFDGGRSVKYVQSLTKKQFETLAGESVTDAFFENAKNLIIGKMIIRADEIKLTAIRESITESIQAVHSDVEFECGKVNGKPFLTIWPEGIGDNG